jgi:hypothetical protein
MKKFVLLLALWPALPAAAQQPFLDQGQWQALRAEANGTAPYENLRSLTRLHRVPATAAFDEAASQILARALEYGLVDARSEQFPVDGQIHYGLMRSHMGWTVKHASLWRIKPDHALIGDWDTDPIRLADYSHSADIETSLVDVGMGTSDADYKGKDVKGRIVLADGMLSLVQRLAVGKYGAAGIVSDMRNQTTAWSGLDPTLVRWGHLDTDQPRGFAFMVSKQEAEHLRSLGTVTLAAKVEAEIVPGNWTVVTGTIPGSDPAAGEVVYSCHLDHQRPGANDNGSGCVAILESARILQKLIGSGKLPRPARSIRFIWGPEVEGTMAFLAGHRDILQTMRADIHMDMVGGDPFKNKSVLHVTETPWSLPSFVSDVGEVLAETIKQGATRYAAGESGPEDAVIDEHGTRNPLIADVTPYDQGSDHDDYDSSTIAVPSIYLRDWPDIYIHTDHDTLEQIDPTKLRRVALLGAASGYALASLTGEKAAVLLPVLTARAEQRVSDAYQRAKTLDSAYEAHNLLSHAHQREVETLRSLVAYSHSNTDLAPFEAALDQQVKGLDGWLPQATAPAWKKSPDAALVPKRIGEFGPLTFQNDDVLVDRLGREKVGRLKLLGLDAGSLYAYEAVNFVDGRRSIGEIRDALAAEFGPVDLDLVAEYLRACQEAKIIAF